MNALFDHTRPALGAIFVVLLIIAAAMLAAEPVPAQTMGPVQWATARITTSTDTAVVAAPGAGVRLIVVAMFIDVEAVQSGALLRVEDGVGGTVLQVVDGNSLTDHDRHFEANGTFGYPLTANTALNVETTGATPATFNVLVAYRVDG